MVDRPKEDLIPNLSVAVVGAGLSGLRAATVLSDHGHRVTVFEKSREPGGRMGALEWKGTCVDTGAQYFTARDARFRRHVTSWIQEGIVSRWEATLASVDAPGEIRSVATSLDRYVGTPCMNRLAEHLSTGLNIRRKCEVSDIEKYDGTWRLVHTNKDPDETFDTVIIATPAKQAISLLPSGSEFVSVASGVRMLPCWALMAVFNKTVSLPYDGLFFNSTPLSWAARNNSKPARSTSEIWMLHAANDWTIDNMEADSDEIADTLLESFFHLTDVPRLHPRTVKTRLWPFAAASPALDEECLWSEKEGIGICGDWCANSRIEGAFLSGTAIAGRLLEKVGMQGSKH